MPGARKFDLEDRFVDFAVQLLELVEGLPTTRAGNHIAGKILRSGTSPAPNYGEAKSAESRNDFVHKLKIALKELRETKVWLKIIRRKRLLTEDEVVSVFNECEERCRILRKSIDTASQNQGQ